MLRSSLLFRLIILAVLSPRAPPEIVLLLPGIWSKDLNNELLLFLSEVDFNIDYELNLGADEVLLRDNSAGVYGFSCFYSTPVIVF